MLLWTLGCAINLAEMRSARVLRGGEVHVSQINSVVVPTAGVREAIDPARTLIDELEEDDSLSTEEREVLVGGLSAIALTGPGYGSGGAWFSVLDWANKAVRVSKLRRLDTTASVTVGREFDEWGRLWWGAKTQVSPYVFELDGSDLGIGQERSTGTMTCAGGFVGGAIGWRWVHFGAELTVLHARGSVDAFGSEHDLSGLILAPHWGLQGMI
ncbi:MAG TPA: hypothetical protein QGF58_27640 [Myxococcota bacterium]|nr:hypothetical protein [Myxococcota bacterium]